MNNFILLLSMNQKLNKQTGWDSMLKSLFFITFLSLNQNDPVFSLSKISTKSKYRYDTCYKSNEYNQEITIDHLNLDKIIKIFIQ